LIAGPLVAGFEPAPSGDFPAVFLGDFLEDLFRAIVNRSQSAAVYSMFCGAADFVVGEGHAGPAKKRMPEYD